MPGGSWVTRITRAALVWLAPILGHYALARRGEHRDRIVTAGLTGTVSSATLEATTTTPPKRHRDATARPFTAVGIQWRTSMAKALVGYLGRPDPRMSSEMRRLQERVRDLENECLRLQTANDALSADAADRDELMTLSVPEAQPALT